MDFFPAIFSLLRPSVLDLGSGTEPIDGQTDDGRQRLILIRPMGTGHKTKFYGRYYKNWCVLCFTMYFTAINMWKEYN